MGRKRNPFKKLDLHISLDYDLYFKLKKYLELNPSIGKSELISNLIKNFLDKKNVE